MLTKNAPRHLLAITVMSQMMAVTWSMQIDLGQYILDENQLLTKSRYVFSDFNGSSPLQSATADFDIGVYQMNYDKLKNSSGQFGDEYVRLYLMLTTSEDLKKITQLIDKNEELLKMNNLTYSYLLKPMQKQLGCYKEIDLTSDNNGQNRIDGAEVTGNHDGNSQFNETDQMRFKHHQKVDKEGVYYASFVYETMNGFKLEMEQMNDPKNRDWDNLDDNLNYDGIQEGQQHRLLYSHFKSKKFGTHPNNRQENKYNNFIKQPHVVVTGNITFRNSQGYLSAEQYANIKINWCLWFTFAILVIIWNIQLFRYWSKIHTIQLLVGTVLMAVMMELVFTALLYQFQNLWNGEYKGFWIFISFMEIIRSVFSRVIILLTALGQHITKASVGDKYLTNIGIVSIFYAISLMLAIIIRYMNGKYQISLPIVIVAELPNYIINILIFVWILLAFQKTLITINESQQFQKSEIVMQMFLVYIISLLLAFSFFIYDKLVSGDPDIEWQSVAYHQKIYFMVFTFLTICYTVILRPSNSKMDVTFNQYRNLRIDDNQDGMSDLNNTMPDCAMNNTTEMTEVQELDKEQE